MCKGWPVLLAAIFSAAVYAGDQRYVIATALNLREKPTSDSTVVAKLPIATQVEIHRLEGQWAMVAVKEGDHAGRTGWLALKYLVAGRPTVALLLEKFDQTPEGDRHTRRMWAERALTLDSSNPEALKRFKDVDFVETMLAKSRIAPGGIFSLARAGEREEFNRVIGQMYPGFRILEIADFEPFLQDAVIDGHSGSLLVGHFDFDDYADFAAVIRKSNQLAHIVCYRQMPNGGFSCKGGYGSTALLYDALLERISSGSHECYPDEGGSEKKVVTTEIDSIGFSSEKASAFDVLYRDGTTYTCVTAD